MKFPMKFLITMVLFLSTTTASADAIDAALANSARPAADSGLDERRKPGQVLRFFGIKPGMAVLDVFAGGGYYTEILSYLVGEAGHVTLYNNNPWNEYVKQGVATRLAGGRLANVESSMLAPEEIEGLGRDYDAALFVLGMHDLYYADPPNWPQIDRSLFLHGIYKRMKPGGILGVIDHNTDDPFIAVTKTLHRVNPRLIIRDLEGVGFELESRSDLLANPEDDHSKSVFLPELRYRTDRSVLLFRKPG